MAADVFNIQKSAVEMKSGRKNLITDVQGIKVGNAQDNAIKSGVTVLTGDQPLTASVHVMGGAPGSRETDLLAPDKLVSAVDALVLSGGSALGLDAASGVANNLRAQGQGFDVAGQKVPIVPAAILFDLHNGGDKSWDENPYACLGQEALQNISADFDLGSVGAGTGATTADLKGGLGSASVQLDNGITIGALVAVNAFGSVTPKDSPYFWAGAWESEAAEYGGLGVDPSPQASEISTKHSLSAQENTTIAIIATDAALTQAQCQRLAVAAHDGMARAIIPSHTLFDGDLVFAASTGQKAMADAHHDQMMLGHAGALALTRAIGRAIWEATPQNGDLLPTFRQKYRF